MELILRRETVGSYILGGETPVHRGLGVSPVPGATSQRDPEGERQHMAFMIVLAGTDFHASDWRLRWRIYEILIRPDRFSTNGEPGGLSVSVGRQDAHLGPCR